jgi:hypothetical protein
VNGHDGLGARRDGGFDLAHVHAERIVAIDEHRPRADFVDGSHGSNERIGGGDHLIAVADVERPERQLERIGSRAATDRVSRADDIGKAPLELADGLAQGEVAGRHEAPQFLEIALGVGELLRQVGVANFEHGRLMRSSVKPGARSPGEP